jgi:hypothetical protein
MSASLMSARAHPAGCCKNYQWIAAVRKTPKYLFLFIQLSRQRQSSRSDSSVSIYHVVNSKANRTKSSIHHG